jgi:2-iminoacetate synthase
LEYLLDYGSEKTKAAGETLIARTLDNMEPVPRERSIVMLKKVRDGRRDVFC